jgi:hypothetical protein
MRLHPKPQDPGIPKWKLDLLEEGRKLLEAQEANRITRAAQLAAHSHALLMRQEIRNVSIGK